MDFFSSMRVSASGLDAQTTRMNTISSNIANAETTEGVDGTYYKRKDPILSSQVDREHFGEILQNYLDEHIQGVQVTGIQESEEPPRQIYQPSHPHANQEGFVSYPNVNPVDEMANMIAAQRSYEANVTALGAAKSMAHKALEIGR